MDGERKRGREGGREEDDTPDATSRVPTYTSQSSPPMHGFIQILVSVSCQDNDPIIQLNLCVQMDDLNIPSPVPSLPLPLSPLSFPFPFATAYTPQ